MLSEQENIDDFFRRKNADFKPDNSAKLSHWQQLDERLSLQQQQPPRKKSWKKITRRTITYLGLAAVIITTTYYAATNFAVKQPARKPITVVKKSLPVPVNLVRNSTNNKPVYHKVAHRSAQPNTGISARKIKNSNGFVKIAEVSDTVFEKALDMSFNPGKENDISLTEGFYKKLTPGPQQFYINPNRDTILFGKSGTVIKIPSLIFINQKRQLTKGTVRIELTECYTYADMLAHGLTTTCKNQLLVSGGMLRISATDEANQTLRIQNYRSLSATMPAESYDAGMQLFIDQPATTTGTVFRDSVTDLRRNNLSITIANWMPSGQNQGFAREERFVHPKKIKLFDVRQNIAGDNQTKEPEFLIKTDKNIPDEKIKYLLSNKYYADATKLRIKKVNSFANAGRAKNTDVLITEAGFMAADSVMLSFELAVKDGFVSREDSVAFVAQVKRDSILFMQKRIADSIAFIKKRAFENTYRFEINGLGWINCDKFYKSGTPMVEFVVNAPADMENANSKYLLLFTNIKSVLQGWYHNGKIDFGKLPQGEPVQLICIAEKSNKVIACIESMRIDYGVTASLSFKETTPEQFKEKLSRL